MGGGVGDVGLRFGCVSRQYAYISRGGVGRVNKFGAFRRNSTDSVRAEFKNRRIYCS
jgi:hypothetical protein